MSFLCKYERAAKKAGTFDSEYWAEFPCNCPPCIAVGVVALVAFSPILIPCAMYATVRRAFACKRCYGEGFYGVPCPECNKQHGVTK